MTSIPVGGDDSQPREWSISNRILILSADSKRALAVLNGRDPLLLPSGSVLQFDDPPGELVVTRVRVIVSEGGGIVYAEAEPVPKPGHYRASAAARRPAERPGHLRPMHGPGTCQNPFAALPYATKVTGLLEDLEMDTPPLGSISIGQLIASIGPLVGYT